MPEQNATSTERSNEQWIDDLGQPGPQRDAALTDLRGLLVRGLGYALASYGNVKEADLEDFAQEAMLKILAGLDSFRGQSRFMTWANKIAVHAAFTELRRKRWRDVSLEQLTAPEEGSFVPATWTDPIADTEQQAIQRQVLSTIQRVIAQELTDKQRQALVAVRVQGMPLVEVARRMGTNANALYKLLYDARQKLKRQMTAQGLSPQDILAAFESG
ncbi:MAG: sigma-70 family RNA polymerase sigma factor [Anaerolineae bacterium]|nr:sigma-70 family RNA polymerase sigma factor [Anaerolineae bacterium]